jgi:hypothetical protein
VPECETLFTREEIGGIEFGQISPTVIFDSANYEPHCMEKVPDGQLVLKLELDPQDETLKHSPGLIFGAKHSEPDKVVYVDYGSHNGLNHDEPFIDMHRISSNIMARRRKRSMNTF